MKLNVSAAGLVCVLLASPALTEEVVLSRPIQAGSLHEGSLDMVAYWTSGDGREYNVTATFMPRTRDATPMRVVMQLADGDDVSFAMPGHRSSLYRFARRGTEVTASIVCMPDVIAGSDQAGGDT